MTAALSDAQLWGVVTSAGWTGNEAVKAFAIARAESGGVTDATHTNANGSTDYGTFQINSVHKDLLASGDWKNPADNARMAKTLYDAAGNRFTPWAAFNSGAYAMFLGTAQAASGGASAPVADTSSPPSSGGVDITSGSTWIRVAEFAAGGILIMLFTASLVANSPMGPMVAKAAKVALI